METIIQATKGQKQSIHLNIPKEVKEEWVQWATGDNSKTSTNDLTFDQANRILAENNITPHKLHFRANFDSKNERHKYILSLCIQYGWSTVKRGRTIADLDKLNTWMYSNLCPVQKTLKQMTNDELTKLIGALESMTKKKYSK